MKPFLKLSFIDLKLYMRNFIAAFFTLAFPLLMLLLFGGMNGNKPISFLGGHGSVDVTVPGYIVAIIIGTTALMSLPLDLASEREQGVLRRMRATPLSSMTVLGAKLAVNLVMSIFGTVLLVGSGIVAYQSAAPASWLGVIAAFLFIYVSLFAFGFVIASLMPNINAARAVSMVIFYTMMFISGGTIPLVFLPKGIQDISRFIPMTYMVNLMQGQWFGKAWDMTATWVLLGVLVAGVLISVRFFKWE